MKFRDLVVGSLAAAALAASSGAAFAHHSFAMYNDKLTHKWAGTVTGYQWTNPHLYVEVEFNVGGVPKKYALEGTALPMLTRLGWTSRTLKPGDKITAQFAPMRNGTPAGILMEITFPDGKVLNTGLPGQANYAKPTS